MSQASPRRPWNLHAHALHATFVLPVAVVLSIAAGSALGYLGDNTETDSSPIDECGKDAACLDSYARHTGTMFLLYMLLPSTVGWIASFGLLHAISQHPRLGARWLRRVWLSLGGALTVLTGAAFAAVAVMWMARPHLGDGTDVSMVPWGVAFLALGLAFMAAGALLAWRMRAREVTG